ncbi:MAG: hypothetical protein WCJ35_20030 [Planctomycetota bacterium]
MKHSVSTLAIIAALAWSMGVGAVHSPAAERPKLLENALKGPMAGVEEIIFAVRAPGTDHWYVNFGYYANGPEHKGYREGGRLCRLNLRTGKLTVLLDDPRGGVRDPQVHYNGQKILFSYRKGGTEHFHLHEINIDGTGLRQLTDGPFDDFESCYLPDGGIIFGSSRCWRWVNCWSAQVAILYRCDGDGGNIRAVSANIEQDNTPWVLPDGRVLYMRWEYVDRSRVQYHHLWTMNPDGTGQMIYYGNMHPGTVMLDAKPIPRTNKVIASFSPGHGEPEHMGHITIVDPGGGPDKLESARRVSKQLFRDPYAFSEDCMLVAGPPGIFLMNGKGETELLYALPNPGGLLQCHEPVARMPRPREQVIASHIDLAKETGQIVLADVTHGRNMQGVKSGEIKKLLVMETLPKPINFSGTMEPISKDGTFTLPRILGTIPVESDGSAFAKVPALRSLFFVALDENDMSVKRMQSFFTVQPGETISCAGCHENRSEAPRSRGGLMALRKPPARIEPIRDVPDVMDFTRDIQPLLDKHCVSCHNPRKKGGNVVLTPEPKDWWSLSYVTIMDRGLVAHGRDANGNRPPRSIGSSASRLLKLFEWPHYDVRITPLERKTIRLWIECGAPYVGTYAALGMKATRFDQAGGFRPNKDYVREMKRYGILPPEFNLAKDPIDCYATDQAYWKLFRWQPR